MRLKSPDTQQFRREEIITLRKKGFTQAFIAEVVKCGQPWVSKVLNHSAPETSNQAVPVVKKTGKQSALNAENRKDLAVALDKGSISAGFETENWTRQRIAQLIETLFKVRHDPSHISRILAKMNYTRQKPKRVDYHHDEQKVREWKETTLPEVKKKPHPKTM